MRRVSLPPEGPPRALARSLRIRDAQEALVRRLGQALVLQWDALSDEMQDLLIDQAVLVDDRDGGQASAEEIESFVRSVSTMALKAKAAPDASA
jgi:hypothetical protein